MRHIANDCLSALIDCDLLHSDGLIAPTPVSLERLHLRRKGPGELIECTLRAILLRHIFHIGETQSRDMQESAHALGLQTHIINAGTEGVIDSALEALAQLRADGFVVGNSEFFPWRAE